MRFIKYLCNSQNTYIKLLYIYLFILKFDLLTMDILIY